IFRQEFWLFPGCKVSAFVVLFIVDQFGIRALCPTPWSSIEFVRKDAYGNRYGNAFGIEISFSPIFPVKAGTRKRRVREPCNGNVVKNVVASEARGFSRKDTRDQLIAARVVVKEIGRQADW